MSSGLADAHEIVRHLHRQVGPNPVQHTEHLALPLADGQAADGEAFEADLTHGLQRAPAQIKVNAALANAELRVTIRIAPIQKRRARALRPAHRKLHRALRLGRGRGIGRAFVEHHLDVGAEGELNVDRTFGRKRMRRAVDVRAEGDALLRDLAERPQRHDLVAAGIGEDRAVPAHEFVEAAEPGDPRFARSQHEMIGVARMISAPVDFTCDGIIALTLAVVPTGMKAGVSIVPREVWTRAAPGEPIGRQQIEAKLRAQGALRCRSVASP